MKIKQLKWEDCTPTISSSVVSRAQALGYTFEVNECLYDDAPYGYSALMNGTDFHDGDNGSSDPLGSKDAAKQVCQEWLEARVLEMVELKAAEIKWREIGDYHWGDGVGYLVKESANHPGKYVAQTGRGWDAGDQALYDSPEAAKQVCQDHKQQQFNNLL